MDTTAANTTNARRVYELLHQTLLQPEDQRREFLDRAAIHAPQLKPRVLSLLERFEGLPADDTTVPDQRFQVSDEVESLGHGTPVDDFTIVRPLGVSGMGEVYLAERRSRHETVAIKVVRPEVIDEITLERFRIEIGILGTLTHEGISRLLATGTLPDGRPYYAMEFVGGWPLTEYCDRRRLSIVERIGLLREVCAIVQYAHQHAVIHRDLKPDNILVRADGRPKLLDFGIAKLQRPAEERTFELTFTGRIPATAVYASPEQLLGDEVGPAADIFSLGVILHQLLTGRRPFTHDETLGRMLGRVEARRPSMLMADAQAWDELDEREEIAALRGTTVAGLVALLKGGLDGIVTRALSYLPSDRQESAAALARELERAEPSLTPGDPAHRPAATAQHRAISTPSLTAVRW